LCHPFRHRQRGCLEHLPVRDRDEPADGALTESEQVARTQVEHLCFLARVEALPGRRTPTVLADQPEPAHRRARPLAHLVSTRKQLLRRHPRHEVLQATELVERDLTEDPVVVDDLTAGIDLVDAAQGARASSYVDGERECPRSPVATGCVQALQGLSLDPPRRRPAG
jgi:hypothetical protein